MSAHQQRNHRGHPVQYQLINPAQRAPLRDELCDSSLGWRRPVGLPDSFALSVRVHVLHHLICIWTDRSVELIDCLDPAGFKRELDALRDGLEDTHPSLRVPTQLLGHLDARQGLSIAPTSRLS